VGGHSNGVLFGAVSRPGTAPNPQTTEHELVGMIAEAAA
jgi:hypothetical protein